MADQQIRIKTNKMREMVIQACYEWRAAETDLSERQLGVLSNTLTELVSAESKQANSLCQLRIVVDNLREEEKSLGLLG